MKCFYFAKRTKENCSQYHCNSYFTAVFRTCKSILTNVNVRLNILLKNKNITKTVGGLSLWISVGFRTEKGKFLAELIHRKKSELSHFCQVPSTVVRRRGETE